MTSATATARTVKVKREKMMSCMTCPLCNNLFTNATTISECLHTFCRNCIYEKITEEELNYCPVCNINLGCVPLEKLRADHSMEDLREKIFPYKRKKVKAPEITMQSVPLPAKRKERSLSSLVDKELNSTSHSKSPTKLIFVQNKENNGTEVIKRENDISNQSIEEPSVTRPNDPIQETLVHIDNKPIPDRVDNGFIPATSGSVKHRKLQDVLKRRLALAGTNTSRFLENGVVDGNDRRTTISNPIWFSLVASDDYTREGDDPLPQISSSYLRVRDCSLPVSFIQKYLMKKLGLASETEVEISLKGRLVSPTLQLHEVVDLWRKTVTKTERIQTSAGSSAKDFVMILSYHRKACPDKNNVTDSFYTKLTEQCPSRDTDRYIV